ncbi:MAG: hypothetical protein C4542_07115 [Dehalococcoidia bacterium]|nr:MAG: hypothetical protein C4542_07115 [Dehalococcoidia bacterium]
MTLLQEIQRDLVNESADITNILRKCKILAAKLGNKEFDDWLENELNGYSDTDALPNYRILETESVGNFGGFMGAQMTNSPIPLSCLPPKYQERYRTAHLREPISYYIPLVHSSKPGESLQSPWSADAIKYIGDKIYKNFILLSARQVIPYGSITALIDTVRNRTLSFILQIESSNPDAGEAPLHSKPVPEATVQQVFTTYIMGNVSNMSAGSQNISTQINVTYNDFASLKGYLKSIGVAAEDIDELDTALKEDKTSSPEDGIGKRAKGWIAKMKKKAETGAWQMTVQVAANLLSTAISTYLKAPP